MKVLLQINKTVKHIKYKNLVHKMLCEKLLHTCDVWVEWDK